MFSLFGSATPFDADVEKATSENNTSEQWDVIMDICDKAGSSSKNAKDCLRSIMKRIGNHDPHVAIQAITLLDACIKNSAKTFHLEVASREFETEFQRLLAKVHASVAQKMRASLKKWAENEFKSDHVLNLIPSLYMKLKNEGNDFSDTSVDVPQPQSKVSKDPNVVSSQQEEDDIAKAIELSLREKSGGDTTTTKTQSLYPSMKNSSPKTQRDCRKVRALYDFEAAEDGEMTFYSGEIIYVLDDSDQNWWTGRNDRGEGLFPSNFVTADLNAEVEKTQHINSKTAKMTFNEKETFDDDHQQQQQPGELQISIDEGKIDRLLYLLHEANPEDPTQDPQEMYVLEAHVHQMLPLIDSELERVDRNHAKLTQLSTQLVEAINMYHMLMRESDIQAQYAAYNPINSNGAYNPLQQIHPPYMPQMQPPYMQMQPHFPPNSQINTIMTTHQQGIHPQQGFHPQQGVHPQHPQQGVHLQQVVIPQQGVNPDQSIYQPR